MVVQRPRTTKILVINPNTNVSITKSFEPILSALDLPSTTIAYWTCPTGPSLIKTQADMYESTSHCIPLLLAIADGFDGFLGACYADHPLVRLLQSYVGSKPVVGIFDASIVAALQFVAPSFPSPSGSKFGIITTGVAYEGLLSQGVKQLLGSSAEQLSKFSGVSASGIGLGDLHADSHSAAREKVMKATARLIQAGDGDVDVVCMGGVILAGMEGWVHEACELELGVEKGQKVKVLDQLLAGMLTLDALLRQKPLHLVDYRRALR
jgi:Asp/Glu/hydantoin racemase